MSGSAAGKRFGWLTEEDELGAGEAHRDEAPAPPPSSDPAAQPALATHASIPPAIVPGTTRRRRRRAKNPNALRNDPQRMMAGARIRRDVRRRVEQALADPVVGEGTNYSLLVEGLLVRWLEEVGYPSETG